MDSFLYLSELQSSFAHLALAFGCALVLPYLLNNRNWTHRTFLFAIGMALAVRYIWWRGTQTLAPPGFTLDCLFSWSFFALEALSVLSSLSAFTILTRTTDRSPEVEENKSWWQPDPPPKVAILIATYNEEQAVLERTVVGAKASDHPDVQVLVLDDGRRDWLRDFCKEHDVRYLRRPDNKGSKAGNINHALGVLAQDDQPPDFIAVLDADFVPHTDFVSRALALFHDQEVGLVQTPQHFFNPDPIQHNLGLSRSYPDEQRFFFDHLQPSRDGWGIAFCCGTSSVIRWRAVQASGGFPTDSITEDFMLTLQLQEHGYRTVYLNEALTEGLAPEGLKEYVTQRARWCLGLMQIARGRLGPFSRNNLRLRDRWSVVDSVFFWLTTFTFRIASMTFPLFYWFFNITVVNASVPDVISYFGAYMVWILFVLNFISSGMVIPIVNDVSQLLGALPISRAAIVGLVKPKGHPFSVTAKGGDRTKVVVQWRLMRPFLLLTFLTVAGVLIGLVSDRFAFNDAGDGKVVILFWTVYNLVILAVTLLVCVELPRREKHYADRPERVVISLGGALKRVWMTDLTQETARLRGVDAPIATQIIMKLKEIGDFTATVLDRTDDGLVVALGLDETQYQLLLKRLYAGGSVPSVTSTRLSAIIKDVTTRFARQ
ncbi:glycosyltransferase [Agrobacterium sp. CR_3]|uniref:glycosyltransferase family 2 protein n=1 Tax=Agrobacterium sp. CR_3 TaxID=3055791 RepID=UPI0035C1DDF8